MLGWLGSHISLLSFRFHPPIPEVIPRQVLSKISKYAWPAPGSVPDCCTNYHGLFFADCASYLQQPAKGLTRRRASPAPQTTEHS